MWNVMGANRLLQQRARKTQYMRHRKTLAQIQPQIDNLAPHQFSFLTSRPKAKQQALELNMTVQANNQDLVRRMQRPKSGVKSASKRPSKNSLHSAYFKHVAAQINEQNQKLLSRLKDATSFLKFDQLEQDHKKHLRWKFSHKKSSFQAQKIRPFSAR